MTVPLPGEERERVARIIDPKAWETLARGAWRYRDAPQAQVEALAKADAIISLLSTQTGGQDGVLKSQSCGDGAQPILPPVSKPSGARVLADALRQLSDAADEINGAIDEQTYDEKSRDRFNHPDDHQYGVFLTAKQVRVMDRAICHAQGVLRLPHLVKAESPS